MQNEGVKSVESSNMNLPNSKEITVIQRCQNSGRLLNPAVKCTEAAIRHLEVTFSVNTQWILAVESPAAHTQEYLDTQLPDLVEAIVTTSQNRAEQLNSIIKESSARIICVIGAGDLVSSNWLSQSFSCLQKGTGKEIFHPAMIVAFGTSQYLFLTPDQEHPDFTNDRLLVRNPFPATCIATKSVFEDLPLQDPNIERGIGHPDWHWVCETTARGYVHKPAAGTFSCCRAPAEHSCLRQTNESEPLLIQPSRLFNPFAQELSAN